MKIGIILGSVREGRVGEAVARWVLEAADQRDVGYELVDLKSFDVPILTSPVHPMAAKKQYDSDAVQRWSDAVDGCDAYVFVTAEYNHSVPGAFKNAVDCLGTEWVGKAVSFVGYGSVGGVRAIEHWRAIIANFSMVDVRAEVNLSTFTELKEGAVTVAPRQDEALTAMFEQLEKAAATAAK